jgi:hypothetical protein
MTSPTTLLLDANLLVLLAVAGFDRQLIGHRGLDVFDESDYELLLSQTVGFTAARTTPHVLAEVNNLADKCVPKLRVRDFRIAFAAFVHQLDEHWIKADELCNSEEFRRLGLADAAIARLANEQTRVISMDAQLCSELWANGVDAINFNHLRDPGRAYRGQCDVHSPGLCWPRGMDRR